MLEAFHLQILESFLEGFLKILKFLRISQLIAVGLNELNGVGFLRGDVHFFVSGVRLTEQNVGLDVCVE